MKILILTQYYPPEIGAPQNRLHELAVRLKEKGVEIEVLTALPNYPQMTIHSEYKNGRIKKEFIDAIPVHRSWIYVSKSKGILSRLLIYFSFVWSSYWRGRKIGNFDFLLVESPPLFLGYSAMLLSKKMKAKLIFNVSDLWPESAQKLGLVTNKSLLKLAYNLERKCYLRSTLITGQTQGIIDDIERRFPSSKVYWLPNGVNLDYYNPDHFTNADFRFKNNFANTDLLIFYGGILGYAQGLEVILKAAKLLEGKNHIKFIIQGTGPEKEKLLNLKQTLALENVYFFDPVSKSEMPNVLMGIDIALIPLKNLPLFQGAIPSKVFEALAMKKPVLLGVDGEARKHFVDSAKAGLYFIPEDENDLVTKINYLAANPDLVNQMGLNAREYVAAHFDRDKIAAGFLEILEGNL